MGLPRSNLVKKSSDAPPATPRVASPFEGATTMADVGAPYAFAPAAPVAAPTSVAPVAPVAPFMPDRTAPLAFASFVAPAAIPAIGEATLREPLHTSPDGVASVAAPLSRAPYPSAISTNELLERAAALGPARMTWESIVLPADPILDEKRQPHVAERRERFTRMVKVGLGACLAVCVVALGISALSGEPSPSADSGSAAPAAIGRTIPTKGIVPIEGLAGNKHLKAVRRTAPAATTAAIVRAKRR